MSGNKYYGATNYKIKHIKNVQKKTEQALNRQNLKNRRLNFKMCAIHSACINRTRSQNVWFLFAYPYTKVLFVYVVIRTMLRYVSSWENIEKENIFNANLSIQNFQFSKIWECRANISAKFLFPLNSLQPDTLGVSHAHANTYEIYRIMCAMSGTERWVAKCLLSCGVNIKRKFNATEYTEMCRISYFDPFYVNVFIKCCRVAIHVAIFYVRHLHSSLLSHAFQPTLVCINLFPLVLFKGKRDL